MVKVGMFTVVKSVTAGGTASPDFSNALRFYF